MIVPDFSREEKLFKKGYKNVAGIDEVGRGPLAGPVVAAAVVFSRGPIISELIRMGVRDSKMITEKKRAHLYEKIIELCDDWSVSIISEKIIDEINILQATKLAMIKAVESLKKIKPDFLLIDGNFTLENFPVSQLAIPKGDQNTFSVSAASILAKVTRDRLLIEFDGQYPEYGFARHKGYGTKEHMIALYEKGPCKIHRKSFSPVDKLFSKFKGIV